MSVFFILLLQACLLAPAPYAPSAEAVQGPDEMFAAAEERYRNGAYDEAAAMYRVLTDSLGIRHPDVYYNLGNSLYRSGSIGRAIVNYERARRLRPRDEDINRNLAYARMAIKDRQPTAGRFILVRWLLELLAGFSCNELFWGASLCFAGLCAALAGGVVYGFGRALILRLVILFSLAFAGAGTMAGMKTFIESGQRHAVVIAPKTEVYSGPAVKYTLRFILHEGTGAVIEKEEDGWALIRLENGEKGWMRRQDAELI